MRHIKIHNLNILYTEKSDNVSIEDIKKRFSLKKIVLPKQTHSNVVCNIDSIRDTCDGLWTDKKFTAIAIKTADCVPVVISDFNKLSVVHSGWRGIVSNIIENSLKNYSSVEIAYIGPSIRKCCYEVSKEFYENLKDEYGEFFYIKNGKLCFSLQEAVASKLKASVEIIESHRCTSCDKNLFSYRKGDKVDRMLTIAWLE